jgi:hypothetical protein
MIDDALIGIEWEPQLTLLEFPSRIISVISRLNLDLWGYTKTSSVLSAVGDPDFLMVYNFKLSGDNHSSIFVSIDESYAPFYYSGYTEPRYLGVDNSMNNVEIRTRPVKLDLLKEHSDCCTEYLRHFVGDLSLLTKGVGVFLPAVSTTPGLFYSPHSGPNKHVNISFPEAPGHIEIFKEYNHSLWNWFSERMVLPGTEYCKLANFKTHITTKPSNTSDYCRLHIMVPYNFTGYEELIERSYKIWSAESEYLLKDSIMDLAKYLDSWYFMNKQKDPILVCHTTGKNVKVVNQLF